MTQCFSTRSNTEKRVEIMTCGRTFLTNFKVFDFEMKHRALLLKSLLVQETSSMNYALSTTVCSNKIILEGEIKYSRMRSFFLAVFKISLIVLIAVVFNYELLMR